MDTSLATNTLKTLEISHLGSELMALAHSAGGKQPVGHSSFTTITCPQPNAFTMTMQYVSAKFLAHTSPRTWTRFCTLLLRSCCSLQLG